MKKWILILLIIFKLTNFYFSDNLTENIVCSEEVDGEYIKPNFVTKLEEV